MNRLKELRKSKGLTQAELGSLLGVSQNTYSYWEREKVRIDNDSLAKLASIYDVTMDYLMGRTDEQPLGAAQQSSKGRWIPVLGDVAAGIPIEAIEDIVDYEEIPNEMAKSGEFFGLRIKGDSMLPIMKTGDVVIVRKQDTIEDGDVAVVLVNGDSATVKKVKVVPNGIYLIPFNTAFSPMLYSQADIDSLPVKILGRVMELRAKF